MLIAAMASWLGASEHCSASRALCTALVILCAKRLARCDADLLGMELPALGGELSRVGHWRRRTVVQGRFAHGIPGHQADS
jgi:hypothetical protein